MTTVEIKCNPIDVTPFQERDSDWEYIDRQGHKHAWYKPEGAENPIREHLWELPTLEGKERVCGYSYDGEPIYGTHYHCKKCDERIMPGWRHTMFRRFIPGPKLYFINDKPVTEEVAMEILKKLKGKPI